MREQHRAALRSNETSFILQHLKLVQEKQASQQEKKIGALVKALASQHDSEIGALLREQKNEIQALAARQNFVLVAVVVVIGSALIASLVLVVYLMRRLHKESVPDGASKYDAMP